MEVISHLLDPLCHKTCWREDQDAIRLALFLSSLRIMPAVMVLPSPTRRPGGALLNLWSGHHKDAGADGEGGR
jgi:hypothetical protein